MVRNSLYIIVVIFLLLATADACNRISAENKVDDIHGLVPAYIKDSIYVSTTNPFSAAKARMGRYLFYDRRLSFNQTKACASCHAPAFSFTDSYRRSIGALGDNVLHNAPALINIIFNKYLTLADSTVHFPEQQINNPMFHQQPAELGWKGNEGSIIERLKKDSLYGLQLPLLFPADKEPFTIKNIQACISSFVKTLLSFDSPYDRYVYKKDTTALSLQQRRGMKLFFSGRLQCASCHGGSNFSVPATSDNNRDPSFYENTGLYNLDGRGAYPLSDQGLFALTSRPSDMGKFRIPTLRNLAFTAPYFHDGTAADLVSVVDFYANGGRNIIQSVNRGDGRKNPYKSHLINGFTITSSEKADLISFLLSLSDTSVCNNSRYNNPFAVDETR